MQAKGQEGRRTGKQDHMKKEKMYQKKYWLNRWVGGKFDFIPHNLLLLLSMALAYILKKSDFLGWILFLHTQMFSLKQFLLNWFGFN